MPPAPKSGHVDPECSGEQEIGLVMETCSVPGASSRLFLPSSPLFCRSGSVSRARHLAGLLRAFGEHKLVKWIADLPKWDTDPRGHLP